jgi:hypothetical protein
MRSISPKYLAGNFPSAHWVQNNYSPASDSTYYYFNGSGNEADIPGFPVCWVETRRHGGLGSLGARYRKTRPRAARSWSSRTTLRFARCSRSCSKARVIVRRPPRMGERRASFGSVCCYNVYYLIYYQYYHCDFANSGLGSNAIVEITKRQTEAPTCTSSKVTSRVVSWPHFKSRAPASSTTPEWTQATKAPGGSAMDQYRNLGMREHLDRLAAEEDRGDAMAAMRCHDDKVTAFRFRGIDDRLIGMLMLDMNHLAGDA